MIKAVEASIESNEDKRRCLDIGISRAGEQSRVVRGNQKTNKEETKHVEQGDSPKHLLDGAGK